MLARTDAVGRRSVLRLMTNEPRRTHGFDLTQREASALQVLEDTSVPAPTSLGLDAEGRHAGVAAHLMSRLPGDPTTEVDDVSVTAMATLLAVIHEVDLPAPGLQPPESALERWRNRRGCRLGGDFDGSCLVGRRACGDESRPGLRTRPSPGHPGALRGADRTEAGEVLVGDGRGRVPATTGKGARVRIGDGVGAPRLVGTRPHAHGLALLIASWRPAVVRQLGRPTSAHTSTHPATRHHQAPTRPPEPARSPPAPQPAPPSPVRDTCRGPGRTPPSPLACPNIPGTSEPNTSHTSRIDLDPVTAARVIPA
jgi:hypothetical protein